MTIASWVDNAGTGTGDYADPTSTPTASIAGYYPTEILFYAGAYSFLDVDGALYQVTAYNTVALVDAGPFTSSGRGAIANGAMAGTVLLIDAAGNVYEHQCGSASVSTYAALSGIDKVTTGPNFAAMLNGSGEVYVTGNFYTTTAPYTPTNFNAESGDMTGWTQPTGSWSASATTPYAGTYSFVSVGAGSLKIRLDLVAAGMATTDLDYTMDCEVRAHIAFKIVAGGDVDVTLDLLDATTAQIDTVTHTYFGATANTWTDWNMPAVLGTAGTRYIDLTFTTPSQAYFEGEHIRLVRDYSDGTAVKISGAGTYTDVAVGSDSYIVAIHTDGTLHSFSESTTDAPCFDIVGEPAVTTWTNLYSLYEWGNFILLAKRASGAYYWFEDPDATGNLLINTYGDIEWVRSIPSVDGISVDIYAGDAAKTLLKLTYNGGTLDVDVTQVDTTNRWSDLNGHLIDEAAGYAIVAMAAFDDFNSLCYIDESGSATVVDVVGMSAALAQSAAASVTDICGFTLTATENTTVATETVTHDVAFWLYEAAMAAETASTTSNTTTSVVETVSTLDALYVSLAELLQESAGTTEAFSPVVAVMVADILVATDQVTNRIDALHAVAEVVSGLIAIDSGLMESIAESAEAAEVVTQLYQSVLTLIEAAAASETSYGYVTVIGEVSESSSAADTLSPWQSVIQSVIEGATAFISLSIGGEVFTGWAMNTNTMAVSEYQGLGFNSLCKHGNKYLGAAEDGIYELAGSSDNGQPIATYIKTGKLDFRSNMMKGMHNAYLAYSATGDVRLKVITAAAGKTVETWYRLTPTPTLETVDQRRIPIGQGLSSRYWQFEVCSEGDVYVDEIGLLPVILSRRV